jgi:hypothetical protein
MLTLILILSLFSSSLLAPVRPVLYIERSEAINYYDKLIKAVVMVESSGNNLAYNQFEGAVGAFQIRQCRIIHYNQLTGSNYTLNDCYDFEVSRKVFLYYTKGRSYELVAKSWNGSGAKTIAYWKRVKAIL